MSHKFKFDAGDNVILPSHFNPRQGKIVWRYSFMSKENEYKVEHDNGQASIVPESSVTMTTQPSVSGPKFSKGDYVVIYETGSLDAATKKYHDTCGTIVTIGNSLLGQRYEAESFDGKFLWYAEENLYTPDEYYNLTGSSKPASNWSSPSIVPITGGVTASSVGVEFGYMPAKSQLDTSKDCRHEWVQIEMISSIVEDCSKCGIAKESCNPGLKFEMADLI